MLAKIRHVAKGEEAEYHLLPMEQEPSTAATGLSSQLSIQTSPDAESLRDLRRQEVTARIKTGEPEVVEVLRKIGIDF